MIGIGLGIVAMTLGYYAWQSPEAKILKEWRFREMSDEDKLRIAHFIGKFLMVIGAALIIGELADGHGSGKWGSITMILGLCWAAWTSKRKEE